jgi:replicative DNA helicase
LIEHLRIEGQIVRPQHTKPGKTQQYHLGDGSRTQADRNVSLQSRLRSLGLLRNKHIPRRYLRAAEVQRRALLAGLLDTDGWVSHAGSVAFGTTLRKLADDVHELLTTLGLQARLTTSRVRGRSEATSTFYRLFFTPDQKVFRLDRKSRRQRIQSRPTTMRRYIVAVRPVPSIPVQCVRVAASDGLYLAGRHAVPTHNTALALQWALLAAGKAFPTLVVSREMKNLALGQRVIAQQAMVSATGLRKRELYYEERRRLERALPRLRGLPVWFDDEASTIRQIRRAVHILRPRLLVVDYVQLVRAPEASRKGDRRLEVTAVSAALKDLTMRYGLSVLALSSLRRLQPEKGVRGQPKRRPAPTLDDLKESGDLEADADMVILLHQPDPNSTDRELLFEKLRNGQGGGSVTLAWHPAYVRFMEVDGAEPSAAALADPDNPLSEVPF